MTVQPLKWKPAAIPRKVSGKGTFWEKVVHPDLVRAMRANPSQTFQLLDDDGNPAEMLKVDADTLRSSCKRPYRIQTRVVAVRGTHRHVWLSMDPGHWERVDTQYAKKGPKPKKEAVK